MRPAPKHVLPQSDSAIKTQKKTIRRGRGGGQVCDSRRQRGLGELFQSRRQPGIRGKRLLAAMRSAVRVQGAFEKTD